MRLSSSHSTARKGVYWTVSSSDHPPTVLMADQRRAGARTLTVVGLRKREVDRTLLQVSGEPPCMEAGDETFAETYGVRSTKANCDGLLLHHVFPNCSLAVVHGYKERE